MAPLRTTHYTTLTLLAAACLFGRCEAFVLGPARSLTTAPCCPLRPDAVSALSASSDGVDSNSSNNNNNSNNNDSNNNNNNNNNNSIEDSTRIPGEGPNRGDRNVGGYDPSERIGAGIVVGDPQLMVETKERSVTSILKELAAIQQQGPQKYCILGTRHCSFLHQQIIELL
jgi:hypothetical protein